MSTAAKCTLGASIVFCCATIYGVHYVQEYEKGLMEAGLDKDEERKKKFLQKNLNMRELEEQKALHDALLKTQAVSQPLSSEPASEDD
ncbi:hypothetical protein DFQ28_008419 [Apophysomyces sp. BC1034]|nr:hypothetical protein DFQ30_006194 [Apophysomyces sp. BC1015]KAG0180625.1 hypothetical protein DFQ29_000285 [Apophysomyces sp. BC1021]KAG0186043.1 hypothetical protein DFQ28_008419 [Apophysomyces sp. BC1034]